jgi:Fe-S-cluster containining protein
MSDQPGKQPPFRCRRCSDCCHGEGGIYLDAREVEPAARILGMEREPFIQRYLRREGERFAVRSGPDGHCLLLGPEGCLIHGAKPAICRRWPFFPALLNDPGAFEEAKLACPGIDPQATHQEFVAYARQMNQKGEAES